MKIYTKRGDAGRTSLFGGAEVDKDDARVATYGTVDELNAALGLAIALGLGPEPAAFIQRIQGELFVLGAELATASGKQEKLKLSLLDNSHVQCLEAEIDRMEEELAALSTFILPGGTAAAACLHVARTICRRAEREYVSLLRSTPVRQELGVYLNRLSDFLFVLARFANHAEAVADVSWLPEKN